MNAKEVTNLKWVHVSDWSELTETSLLDPSMVCKADVKIFVENIFRDVARELKIPYRNLKPILKRENSPFYSALRRTFRKYYSLNEDSPRLLAVQKLLRIPDINNNFDHDIDQTIVDEFLTDFSSLNNSEKLEVLKHLQDVNFKINVFTE